MTAKEFDNLMEGREELVQGGVSGVPLEIYHDQSGKRSYWIKEIKWNPTYLTPKQAQQMVQIMHDMFGVTINIVLDEADEKFVIGKGSEGFMG